MKKLLAVMMVLFLFYIPVSIQNEIVVENGESIQDAINSAEDGDIIVIEEGIYRENLVINKSISLIGKGKVIVDGNGSTAIKVNVNGVKLANLHLINSNNAILELRGGAIIKNCSIYNGKFGIIAYKSSIIEKCTIWKCGGGIVLYNGSIVEDSILYKCGLCIEIYGKENLVKNCTSYYAGVSIYMENATGNKILGGNFYKNNNNQGEIFLLNSQENEIMGCNISYGSFAVRMIKSDENVIRQCNIYKSRYGIKMESCNGNIIQQCRILKNRFGVTLENCKEVKINYNDIVGNYMYSIDAKYSTCDASHNYWGGIFPKKIHKILSRIKLMPYYITPLYGEFEINELSEEKEKKENYYPPKRQFFDINLDDFDPLVDVKVCVEIKRARSIDGNYPFKLKILIDGKANITWIKKDEMLGFKAWQDVDDGKQNVEIEFVAGEKKKVIYDLATGSWYGDDFLGDEDGYGHLKFRNAEIWFDIGYNDYDGDGLTYWEEVNMYHTDPMANDYGKDYDNDGLPIQWEDKYGFNDFVVENHSIDYDEDGLNDYEEYYTWDLLSDPFAKDIFVEVDYMEGCEFYEESIEMLYSAFTKHNINLHIVLDEEIPFKEIVYYKNVRDIYWKYFLHDNISNPKHGIFHYALIAFLSSSKRGGHAFVGWDNLDAFMLATGYINKWRVGKGRKIAYASLFMHEFGHTLGLFDDTFGGIDNESCNVPWHKGYWIYRNYKSCMNYRYAFGLVDYSDGTHGRNDFNDWQNINLTFFKNSIFYPKS